MSSSSPPEPAKTSATQTAPGAEAGPAKPTPAKPAPEVRQGFSLGPQQSAAPSYSHLLQDIKAGRVKNLELSPAQRVVTATFQDGRIRQVAVFSDSQQLLRTAQQASVPLTVRDERRDDAMAGLVTNGLLVALLIAGLVLLVRRSAQVANKAMGFGRSQPRLQE